MKKVAIVLLGVDTPKGGMYEYGKCWLEEVKRNGEEPIFVASRGVIKNSPCRLNIAFDSEIKKIGYKFFFPNFLFNYRVIQEKVKKLCLSLESIGCEEIKIVDDFSYSTLFVGLILKYINKAVVVSLTVHDPISHEGHFKNPFAKAVSKLNRVRMRYYAKNNLKLHFHCTSLIKGTLWEEIENVEFIPHPLPIRICNKERISSTIRFVFAGRIEIYKGLDDLLFAYNLLKNNSKLGVHIELLIVGRGNISSESLTKISDDPSITLINEFVSDQQLHQYIADSDVMVLPYRSATASGVGSLGIAYALPLIVTDVGTLPSLTISHEYSVICSPNNVNELVKGMEGVVEKLKISYL